MSVTMRRSEHVSQLIQAELEGELAEASLETREVLSGSPRGDEPSVANPTLSQHPPHTAATHTDQQLLFPTQHFIRCRKRCARSSTQIPVEEFRM